jgi:branched-chain amino acid transport system permease protein
MALGAIYALIALGFVVIYRASKVFNFAQGEFLTFGAYLMTTFAALGLPWPLALAATMLATGLLAATLERAALRPMVGRPVFVTIILTIVLGVLLRLLVVVLWKAQSRAVAVPWNPLATASFGDVRVSVTWLATVAVAAVAVAAFFLLTRFTRMGVAMRATSENQEVAQGLGIRVGRVLGTAWFLSGAFAALAGAFMAASPKQVTPLLGWTALKAFPAVVVGGLDSLAGAVVAGFALGLLEVLAQGYQTDLAALLAGWFPSSRGFFIAFLKDFHAVFPYVVMIVFLAVRPYGLFGRRRVERV